MHNLRSLIEAPGIHAAPAVYDCLGALCAQRAGFRLLFTSGYGIAASRLGRPDLGYLTATEMVDAAGRIAASVELPVIADLDTGYGGALNVIRTVEDAVRAGVAGILLEDQEWPKRCGHFEGKRLVDAAEHAARIRAARHAAGESGLVIVARTDARAVEGLDSALERGARYLDAGADVLFVEAPQSRAELERIAARFAGAPLMANLIEGGRTPNLSSAELGAMGYRLVAFALSGLFAAAQALGECFSILARDGATASLGTALDFEGFKALIDMDRHLELERRFTATRPPR